MRRTATGGAIAAVLALVAGDAAPAPAPREAPPGEGVVCLWGLVSVSAEVGRRCFPGENPAFQAALEQSESRIDDFVRANDKSVTPEAVARFKASQAHVGRPVAEVCFPDAIALYRAFEAHGADRLRAEVDRATARPGAPTWGDCL